MLSALFNSLKVTPIPTSAVHVRKDIRCPGDEVAPIRKFRRKKTCSISFFHYTQEFAKVLQNNSKSSSFSNVPIFKVKHQIFRFSWPTDIFTCFNMKTFSRITVIQQPALYKFKFYIYKLPLSSNFHCPKIYTN